MKQKISNHMKNNWQEYASVILMLFIITVAMIYKFNLFNFDITYPIAYSGGDDLSMLVDAKMFSEQGWIMTTDRLGAPNGTQMYDFSANYLHNAGMVIMKIFVFLAGGNAVVGFNLTYLSIFIFAGVVSYIVMRQIGINCWISALTSAVYGMSPFMLARGVGHMVLAEAYFVPLSFLLCFYILEREEVFKFDRQFFKRPINYVVIVIALLIANNGIGYYPYFTCFILAVTGVCKWLKNKKPEGFVRALSICAVIAVFFILCMVPAKIYNLQHGANQDAVSRAGFIETEMYGLKLIMLFMPRNAHGIGIIQKAIDMYDSNTTYLNENVTEYLGIVAIIGFFILMFTLFMNRDSALKKRLGALSEINIMLVLLGTTSGLGTMIAFLITDKIRGYNRISIFIEYVCILAVAMLMGAIVDKLKADKRTASIIVTAVTGLVCVFSIWEGCGGRTPTETYEAIQDEYASDDKLVSYIESSVDDGSMIYQLPYHGYPEGGSQNDMWDYHLFVGYLHSDTLKWSYGSVKGREGDSWNEEIGSLKADDMVKALKEAGFAGIYIDRRAYLAEQIEQLESDLTEATGTKPVISDNGCLSFYKF